MARTRTLTQLLGDLRWQADIEGMTDRHTDVALTRALNQSIQEYRELVSDSGAPHFLASVAVTFPAGPAATGAGYGRITSGLPATAVRYYILELLWQNELRVLARGDYESRNDDGSTAGVPDRWWVQESGAVHFAPAANGTYTGHLHYLPAHTDLAAGGDTFDGVVGWEEWVIFNAAVKIAVRDDRPELAQMLGAERARLELEIRKNAPRRQRGAPSKRTDARARRINIRSSDRWR